MASVLKRNGKWYARIKFADGQFRQRLTGQAKESLAMAWAVKRCLCGPCGRARDEAPPLPIDPEPIAPPVHAPARTTVGELMDTWEKTLRNRSAGMDRSRIKRHVRPHFAAMVIEDVTLAVVMVWIDTLRVTVVPPEKRRGRRTASADGKMCDATVLSCFSILSRFFSWAIERGHAQFNPCRLVPQGRRPKASPKRSDIPWISDDKTVRDIMGALAPPFRQMFYLGNRSGLRPGETRGLKMSDLGYVADGVLRVRFSDLGCLKEDKRQEGKVKWPPAPDDFDAVVGPWLDRRCAEGAQPEDHVFMPEISRGALKQRMEAAWREAIDALGLDIGQYQGTRHSMISRNLDSGVPPHEVAQSVGHSTEATTRRHYDHVIRPTYRSPLLSAGIGAKVNEDDAKTLPFKKQA